MLLGAVAPPLQNSCSFSLQLQCDEVVALLTSEPQVRGCNLVGCRYWEPLNALGAWVFLWHILDLAKRLQRGGGNIDFDCIFAGHQVTQMVELAKRLQSGEGDIDFDCIFAGDQVGVAFTCGSR